jgi:diguanylate cyclase (GGDEF)-like protein
MSSRKKPPLLIPGAFRLRTLNVWTRIASLGLTAVLVSSTAFSFGAERTTRDDLSSAKIAAALDDDFQAARYAVAGEESLERKYRLELGKEVFGRHRAAAAALAATMKDVLKIGTIADRSVANAVLRAHTLYLSATTRMFAAVDRGDTSLVIALDHGTVDPVFDTIQGTVERRADFNHAAENASFERLRDRQQRIMASTIVLSALGLLCLGIFIAALLSFQRRLRAAHQAEVVALEEAALIDNLTGIGNHRAYREELIREVSRAQRHGEPLSLAFLGVDDFKVVNDRNGHMHGDAVLVKLAGLLRSLRAEDRAFRIGGDEFAVLLAHTSKREARETMQRLRVAMEAQTKRDDRHDRTCDVERF